MEENKKQRRRAPRGVVKREIAMRLMPEERQEFDNLAASHAMTDGALSREIYLAGLPVWKEQQASMMKA